MRVMSFKDDRQRPTVTLNVTPLIDVLFLFIIFFMLTGTFKRVGELELQLPDSSTAEAAAARDEIRQVELVATEDGRLLLDQIDLDRAELKSALEAILADHPEGRVLIKAESGVKHGEVVLLLDIVRDAGFLRAGIGTQMGAPADSVPR